VSVHGAVDLRFDLSGIGLALGGVPAAAAPEVLRRWGAYRSEAPIEELLAVRVAAGSWAVDRTRPFAPKAMHARFGPAEARFDMDDGRARVGPDGRAWVELAGDLSERAPFALMNLVRACLAWRMPSRGGALLHAGALVVGGRAWVLAGREGAGKSTWVEQGRRGGAAAVSDDLALVDGAASRIEVVGAPFRSDLVAPYARGRWPLAGILFPVWGPEPVLAPVARAIARARVAANLPFVERAWGVDERLPGLVDRLVSEVPCLDLTFPPTPAFLALLART